MMAVAVDSSHAVNGTLPGSRTSSLDPAVHMQAVERLGERIKVAQLASTLRARMSLASYKSVHHIEQVPFKELESKLPKQTQKRRSIDESLPSPRSPFLPYVQRDAEPTLYGSILTAPPPKRTRGISPPHTPRNHYGGSRSAMGSPESKTGATSPRVRTSTRKHPPGLEPPISIPNANDPDALKVAATLTSLMVAKSSPQPKPLSRTSSMETTMSSGIYATNNASLPSFSSSNFVTRTPPSTPPPKTSRGPTGDQEAAELMIYLATSPSPAQKPAVRHKIPLSTGRVLFPNGNDEERGVAGGDSQMTLVDEEMQSPCNSQDSMATAVDLGPPMESISPSSLKPSPTVLLSPAASTPLSPRQIPKYTPSGLSHSLAPPVDIEMRS